MAQVVDERRIQYVAGSAGGYDRRSAGADRRKGGADRRKNCPDRRQSHLSVAEPVEAVEISVVMPCLNEVESVGICVQKAWEGIRLSNLSGEVIVADNGSTDGSVEAARAAGARVVHQSARGYGNAYLAGFAAARGSIIVMGDSDNSYDFTVLPDLIAPIIENGQDYVLGSRLMGEIEQGAMPWSHRWIGNPILTTFLNLLFKLRVSDAHSGYRVFTREALERMDLQSEGMEFASEIVVKAAGAKLSVTEVPIKYHARIGESKLNSISDAWRHIRFLLLSSPSYLFLIPGAVLVAIGLIGQLALFGVTGGMALVVSKALLAISVLIGMQVVVLGSAATTGTNRYLLGRANQVSKWVSSGAAAKKGFLAGTILVAFGFGFLIYSCFAGWGAFQSAGPGVSALILSVLLPVLGVTLWFDAFFLSLFQATQQPDERVTESAPVEARPPHLVAVPEGLSFEH
jgi:glycosyltransferase involved in cell wall biosynthesis